LRTLERHLRRSKKLRKRHQKIHRNLIRNQIPQLEAIREEADALQQRILFQEMPNANQCRATNANLREQIQQALNRQRIVGYISSAQLDQISQQLSQQNRIVSDYNRQIQDFDRQHDRFSDKVQKIQKTIADNDSKLSAMYEENETVYRESQDLFKSGQVMVFNSAREEERAEKLIDEIWQNYEAINDEAEQVQSALERFWRIQPSVIQAINNLHEVTAQLNNVIAAANSLLDGLAGVELRSDDRRTMRISAKR
jgi:chromosome segregation ATPase